MNEDIEFSVKSFEHIISMMIFNCQLKVLNIQHPLDCVVEKRKFGVTQ